MLDVLCPLITESDNLSNELLDIIFINMVEPLKTQRKNAYTLAKDLIVKTADTLEGYVSQMFTSIILIEKPDKTLQIATKIYDLIYEVNTIAPSLLLHILPHLECKLKSANENDRISKFQFFTNGFFKKRFEFKKIKKTVNIFFSIFRVRFHAGSHVFREKQQSGPTAWPSLATISRPF